jgi:hypothetical protein
MLAFWLCHRLSGSNPQKMRFCPGWRQSSRDSEPQETVSLETRFGLWLLKESLSTKGKEKWGMENV